MADPKARALRNNPTDAERSLWTALRMRQVLGHRFRRQRPIGSYIVDFVCLERRLIVEVDGGQHQEETSYDARRDHWLASQGYRVLRFWNNQILIERDAVLGVIAEALSAEDLPPS